MAFHEGGVIDLKGSMSVEVQDSNDFNREAKAMMHFQRTQLIANLLTTSSMLASVIAPVVLTVNRGSPLWLLMFLIWPACIFLMGLVKHGGAPTWFPALALLIFFVATPVPSWYWLIALATMMAYHVQQNEIPVQRMKLDQAFKEIGQ